MYSDDRRVESLIYFAFFCFIFMLKCQLLLACLASCLGINFLKHTYNVDATIMSP